MAVTPIVCTAISSLVPRRLSARAIIKVWVGPYSKSLRPWCRTSSICIITVVVIVVVLLWECIRVALCRALLCSCCIAAPTNTISSLVLLLLGQFGIHSTRSSALITHGVHSTWPCRCRSSLASGPGRPSLQQLSILLRVVVVVAVAILYLLAIATSCCIVTIASLVVVVCASCTSCSSCLLLGQLTAFFWCFAFLVWCTAATYLHFFKHLDELVNLVYMDRAFVLSVKYFENGLVFDLINRELIGCHY